MMKRLKNPFNIKNPYVKNIVNCLIVLGIMAGLCALLYYTHVPFGNLILFLVFIFVTLFLGLIPGAIALGVYVLYTMGVNSIAFSFLSFNNDEVFGETIVSIVVATVAYGGVSFYHIFLTRIYDQLDKTNTELEKEYQMLKVVSNIDALTNVKNRFSLMRDLNLLAGHNVKIALFDIDDFKKINDTYGHDGGDDVLIKMGFTMLQMFDNDCCYRFGGDEFIIIDKNGMDQEEFINVMKDFKNKTAWIALSKEENVKISIGITYGKVENLREAKDMLKLADKLLYESKRGGKDRVVIKEFIAEDNRR